MFLELRQSIYEGQRIQKRRPFKLNEMRLLHSTVNAVIYITGRLRRILHCKRGLLCGNNNKSKTELADAGKSSITENDPS